MVAFHGPPPAPGGGVAPLGGFSGLGNMHRVVVHVVTQTPLWGLGSRPRAHPVGEGDDEALDSLLKQEGRGCVCYRHLSAYKL